MASSPESRPDGVADAVPADKHETSTTGVEESSISPGSKSTPPAEATSAEQLKTSENIKEIEAEKKAETDNASTEPPIPASDANGDAPTELPPLPNEPLPTDAAASPPPLPDEPLPDEMDENDDGWDPVWSDEHQAWYFVNRFTQQTQWENPRVPDAAASTQTAVSGYNPAIHGDYDPNAWYAKGSSAVNGEEASGHVDGDAADPIAVAAAAGAAMIQSRGPGSAVERYSHDAKAGRQLNNYFDVDAASNSHDGRSLKAERSGIKPSKSELKAFKEKRRARKEEKRRAWLRD
ncbi:hypothetical protein SEUCBS139899_008318 [Sporothrix eucalyptigena]|uniref:WW domain-containing protein n=1 Tax=Sporothrix eucalyptigena TaxID=1812306 RepID=A0ABP0D1M7_9PEZI